MLKALKARRDELKAKLDSLNERIEKLKQSVPYDNNELHSLYMYRNYIDNHIALYDGKSHKDVMRRSDDVKAISKHLENLTDIYGYYIPVAIKDERQLVSNIINRWGPTRNYELHEFNELRNFYKEIEHEK